MGCENCAICTALDSIKVRDVLWCPICALREIALGLPTCIMCAADQPAPS
jgi:hypothetical protein